MRQPAAFTLIELLVALAVAAVLAMTAVSAWSSHQARAQRASARAALVAAMAELERRHAHEGGYSTPTDLLARAPGYQLSAKPCAGQSLARCVDVSAEPARPDTSCGTLILRSTGERFTQVGSARQPAPPACWP